MGVLTLACLLFTAYISVMNLKGKTRIPFKWHPRMAIITITLALIHGILGVLLYF
ncbi:hypothetical protein KY308_01315 [Candidatus Woesearchaeota archaeon]|nr:hypothetical protein [Candidatus Woesearchaeota archaeon]